MLFNVLQNINYILEEVSEAKSFSASAGFAFANPMPFSRDLVGLIFELTAQVDSGTGVTKTDDGLFQMLAELNINADGQTKIKLRDIQIKWFSWFLTGEKPVELETPDATSQSDKAAYVGFFIPCGFKKGNYTNITVHGTWGAVADIDAGTSFNVDSGTLTVTAVLGNGVTKEYFTKEHSDTKDGDGQKTIPDGTIEGLIVMTNGHDDNIDNIELAIDGFTWVKTNHEALRLWAKQVHGIDLQGPADVDAEKKTGIIFIDGQRFLSKGGNALIKYSTTTSDTLYILYILSNPNL